MKKTITFRWIAAIFAVLFIAVLFIYGSNSAMAQIKVVGDDYSTELTGSKSYYDCDVDFDKYFPSVSPIDRYSRIYPNLFFDENLNVNLTGDTIFLITDFKQKYFNGYYNSPEFAIINDSTVDLKQVKTITIPAGYYTITGYVFCQENEDSIRKAAGLNPFLGSHNEEYKVQRLKEEIFLCNARGYGFERLLDYQKYIVLTSLDKTATYYVRSTQPDRTSIYKQNTFLLLRYYNQLKSFVGKEVFMRTDLWDGRQHKFDMISTDLIKDGLSGTWVKIEDGEFEVVDVVLKENIFYLVLKGDDTGTFAMKTDGVYYSYSTDKNLRFVANYHFLRSDWKVKEYDSSMDIPIIRACYDHTVNNNITFIVEEKNWNTLEQRAKKTQEQQEKERKLQQQREQQEKAKKDAAFKQQMIVKHGSQFGELVANKQVAIGMTKDMCRDAWGGPINSYRTTTRLITEEVWCYNYKTRIYFVNDKVVRIEN